MIKFFQKRETVITALAFFTWGIIMLCRTSFGYFLEALTLTSSQAGIANFMTAFFVCIMMFPLSNLADKKRAYSPILICSLLLCGISMFLLSRTTGFYSILFAKALLGIGCAPVFTLLTTLVKQTSTTDTYPINAGILANGEAILNTIIGPIFIVSALQSIGFNHTIQILVILLLLLSSFWFVDALNNSKNKYTETIEQNNTKSFSATESFLHIIFRNRNLCLCALGAIFSLLACWSIYIYVPTMLTEITGLSDSLMSYIMMLMGICMALLMIVRKRIIASTFQK